MSNKINLANIDFAGSSNGGGGGSTSEIIEYIDNKVKTLEQEITGSVETINSTITDNEEVTAGALNVLNSSIDNKVDKETGKVLSSNDYTTAEKTKLAGIAEGANKTVVDSELTNTSSNSVQSSVLYKTIKDNEEVTAGALYALNERLDNILSLKITSNGTTLTLQEWIDKIGN